MKFLKFLLPVLLLLLVGCGSKATPKEIVPRSFPGWTKVSVGSTAKLEIPPTLEVQSEEYRKQVIAANPLAGRLLPSTKDGVVIQPKGYNKGESEALKRFAQVQLQTINSHEKVPRYGFSIGLKPEQIKEFGAITRESIERSESKLDSTVKLGAWQDMRAEIINGAECLYIAYERTKGKEPTVAVERYTFFNTNKVHNLCIYYRVGEKDYWTAKDKDIRSIVETLVLTPSK